MFYERRYSSLDGTRDSDASSLRGWVRRLVSEMAIQDWLVTSYLVVLLGAVLVWAPASEARTVCAERLAYLLGCLAIVLVAVRGSLLARGRLAALAYRVAIYGVVQVSYFLLRPILKVVTSRTYDAQFLAFDLKVFGVEPSLWMDRFVSLYTTEWFAFFYYSYFFVLAAHVLPLLFLSKRLKLFAEFAMGLFTVYCVAHLMYMVAPGYGPYRFLASEFHNPLVGGFWYERVLEAVNGAGAQKDIFPSLHTAGPFFIFLFSARHRDKLPFKYSWPVAGFFSLNIILATMFLRWHYVIDIVAGVALASGAMALAAAFSRREVARREAAGLQPVWMPLLGVKDEGSSLQRANQSAALGSAGR
jgi:hypothetical protein